MTRRSIWIVNFRDYTHFLCTFQFLEWYIPLCFSYWPSVTFKFEPGPGFRILSETFRKHTWKFIFLVRNKFFYFFRFFLSAMSTFLQNEFTGNSLKLKSRIQSIPNKFDVPRRTWTLDLKVLSINDTLQLSSSLNFSFFPDTPQAIFVFPQWWTTLFLPCFFPHNGHVTSRIYW